MSKEYIPGVFGLVPNNETESIRETPVNRMTYNECRDRVIFELIEDSLYQKNTRKELANMLRILEPYLVKQSPNACYSMTKRRLCDHIRFAVVLHYKNILG